MNPAEGAGAGSLGTPESVTSAGGPGTLPEARAPRRIEKPWGFELIWAEAEEYTGKLLVVEPGEALSLQFHEEKDETLFLLEGELVLELGTGVHTLREVPLPTGRAIRLRPGILHRMTAVSRCTLLEASTPELDDVVRVQDRYGRAPEMGSRTES